MRLNNFFNFKKKKIIIILFIIAYYYFNKYTELNFTKKKKFGKTKISKKNNLEKLK